MTSLRQIYPRPDVTDEYSIEFGEPDLDGIVRSATSASLARTGHGCAGARVSAAGVVLSCRSSAPEIPHSRLSPTLRSPDI